MTTQPADPRQFASWEDAFQHPIPAVSLFEQQLRNHAEENRQKLRGLVGASYRTLLETAEAIVQMDGEIQEVERTLAHTGPRSNPQAIVERSKNQTWFSAPAKPSSKYESETVAELRLLQCCITVVAKGLKSGDSPLVIAKVMVISRLLHKSITQRPRVPNLVDALRSRLANLRARLLKGLEESLAKPNIETSVILDSLCAYALITSSTPTDVLRHFHQSRSKAIKRCLERRDNIGDDVITALNLYLRTIQDSQSLFPQQLATALGRLKAQPLVSQKDVQQLKDLRLESLGDWLHGDLRNYTPWLRHDELVQASAKAHTQKWTTDALINLTEALSLTLADVEDMHLLLALRRRCFETWPWFERTPAFFDKISGAEELRKVFNDHFQRLIFANVARLHNVISLAGETLANGTQLSSGGPRLLWSVCPHRSERATNSSRLEHSVVDAYKGYVKENQEMRGAYLAWRNELSNIQLAIKSMRDDVWDDAYSDDEEDDFHLDDRRAMLSEDDPRHLEKVYQKAVEEAELQFIGDYSNLVSNVLASEERGPEQAIFLLRVLSDIRRDISSEAGSQITIEVPQDVVSKLWSFVVSDIAAEPLACLQQRLSHLSQDSAKWPGGLCGGSHDLPTHPSSFVFRFLVDLTKDMTGIGHDLWSASAKLALKELATNVASEAMAKSIDAVVKSAATNGFTKTNGDHDSIIDHNDNEYSHQDNADSHMVERESKLRQLLFDVLFLQKALYAGQPAGGGGFDAIAQELQVKLEIEAQLLQRLRTTVIDYWKKTYLLFAILC